ncbi:MAG: hypothetical protein LBD15_04165 [Holosporales bacterium]|jgi:hypothetical protein|nr:hypothetical protein [Holosporales bacterium]
MKKISFYHGTWVRAIKLISLALCLGSLAADGMKKNFRPKPREQAKFVILDEDNVRVEGELDHRGNLTQSEARKDFIVPVFKAPGGGG